MRKSEERLRRSREAGGIGLWDRDLGSDGLLGVEQSARDILGAPRAMRMRPHLPASFIRTIGCDQAATEAALRGERPARYRISYQSPGGRARDLVGELGEGLA